MKPKLTLRDLFWLVLVVGLALGWAMHYRSLSREIRVLRQHEQLMKLNGFDDPTFALPAAR